VVLTLAFALVGTVYFIVQPPFGSLAGRDHVAGEWLEARAAGFPYQAPDGSSIRLDAHTRGRFTSDDDRAQFDLHGGRAVFEVSKRPGQDWTVVAGDYSVHVIGTRFAVSYDQKVLDVRVEEGRVRVRLPQRSDAVVLEAGAHLRAQGDQLSLAAREPVRTDDGDDAAPEPTPSEVHAAPTDSANPAQLTPPGSIASHDVLDWHAFYVKRQYVEALRAAKSDGFEGLTRTLTGSTLLELADAARLAGDSQAALLALTALERRFADVAFSRDVDFLIARLHIQRGERNSAVARLTTYLERGDGARYSLEALGRLIELQSRGGDEEKARELARRYLERAPNGPYHRLAEALLEQR
jgi:hypothetical protein